MTDWGRLAALTLKWMREDVSASLPDKSRGGDTIGGVATVIVTGVPTGLGSPLFMPN